MPRFITTVLLCTLLVTPDVARAGTSLSSESTPSQELFQQQAITPSILWVHRVFSGLSTFQRVRSIARWLTRSFLPEDPKAAAALSEALDELKTLLPQQRSDRYGVLYEHLQKLLSPGAQPILERTLYETARRFVDEPRENLPHEERLAADLSQNQSLGCLAAVALLILDKANPSPRGQKATLENLRKLYALMPFYSQSPSELHGHRLLLSGPWLFTLVTSGHATDPEELGRLIRQIDYLPPKFRRPIRLLRLWVQGMHRITYSREIPADSVYASDLLRGMRDPLTSRFSSGALTAAHRAVVQLLVHYYFVPDIHQILLTYPIEPLIQWVTAAITEDLQRSYPLGANRQTLGTSLTVPELTVTPDAILKNPDRYPEELKRLWHYSIEPHSDDNSSKHAKTVAKDHYTNVLETLHDLKKRQDDLAPPSWLQKAFVFLRLSKPRQLPTRSQETSA